MAAVEIRDFQKQDWWAYAGAEHFGEDAEPLIAIWSTAFFEITLVGDPNAVALELYEEDRDNTTVLMLDSFLDKSLVRTAMESIINNIQSLEGPFDTAKEFLSAIRALYPTVEEITY